MFGKCELCNRETEDISFHHLIPQTCHTNKWFKKNFTLEEMKTRGIYVCRECHHAIHEFIPSEKDLGKKYNTKNLLLSHYKIYNHVNWIKDRAFQRKKV